MAPIGSRIPKLGGAQVTNAFKYNLTDLLMFGTTFSFGLTAVWIIAAMYVGNENAQLIKENKIVE